MKRTFELDVAVDDILRVQIPHRRDKFREDSAYESWNEEVVFQACQFEKISPGTVIEYQQCLLFICIEGFQVHQRRMLYCL